MVKTNISLVLVSFLSFQAQANPTPKVYDLSKYGIHPNIGNNNSAIINQAIQKVVSEAGKNVAITIKFKKGRYDFRTEGALKKEYYISNHDQDNPKTVGIAFEHYDNM